MSSGAKAIRTLGSAAKILDTAEGRRSSALHKEVTQVFEQLRDPILRYLYGILQDAGEAEDATQEAFLKLFKELQRGRDVSARAWLFRVAHNLAIDRLRQRAAVTTLEDEAWNELCETKQDLRLDTHHELLRAEREQRLQAITEQLTPQERRCIGLRMEGFRYREIAEVLGVRISSVQNYLARAVKKIMREIDA